MSARSHREGLFSAVSAGLFFVLVGMLFVTTPALFEKIVTFFDNLQIVSVPHTSIQMPAPTTPRLHAEVYSAVWQFSLIWALLQIGILVLRFLVGSQLEKKAETLSNVIFWLGSVFLIGRYLDYAATTATWFIFWTTILMLLGVSLVARATFLAFAKPR